MNHVLWVALGSGLGGMVRYGAAEISLATFGPAYPVGTLAVNVLGSLLIGMMAGLIEPERGAKIDAHVRLLVMAGFCGGLTTFSFFSWQMWMMVGSGLVWLAVLYAFLSVVIGMFAVWGGYRITSRSAVITGRDRL
jgi:fluoride exporter